MKKWNNPELMVLGVENTRDDEWSEFGIGNHHYCHRDDNNECENGDNHKDDGASNPTEHVFTGSKCSVHGPGNSKCCCFGLS